MNSVFQSILDQSINKQKEFENVVGKVVPFVQSVKEFLNEKGYPVIETVDSKHHIVLQNEDGTYPVKIEVIRGGSINPIEILADYQGEFTPEIAYFKPTSLNILAQLIIENFVSHDTMNSFVSRSAL